MRIDSRVVGIACNRAIWLCASLLLPAWAAGQEADRSTTAVPAAASHRFFDANNIALTGMEAGALLADGFYTQRARQRYPDLFQELDPLARPFVLRGWSGQIVGGTIVVCADVGLRYWMHRKKHHKAERLLPLVLTVYGAVGAIHGARELRRAERDPYGVGSR